MIRGTALAMFCITLSTMDLHSQRGVALPLTILMITIITMLLTAALARARVDQQMAESNGETTKALSIAKSGV